MKNLGFLAAMALFMVFGCVKDEMTTDEQDSISVEENDQPVIYGERGPSKGNCGVGTIIEFNGISFGDDYLSVCPIDVDCDRKLLENGKFSGSITGFGKIKPELSEYTFIILPAEDNPGYGLEGNNRVEEFYYKLEAHGTVSISDNDYFDLTITGYLHPMDPIWNGNKNLGSVFSGVATIDEDSGVGRFVDYSETFEVWSGYTPSAHRDHTWFVGANLDTGELTLHLVINL